MQVPDSVIGKLDELHRLCEEHPEYIPIPELAAFLHTTADGLRNSLERGQCPFGFCWKLGTERGFKVPTVKFYLWFTNSGATIPLEEVR